MDIESFVSEALQQLGAGVEKARAIPGITVCPSGRYRDAAPVFVEFDLSVAVTSRVEGGAEAKAKLQVIGLDLGSAELKGGIDHTHVQRVKFQVPISFPA